MVGEPRTPCRALPCPALPRAAPGDAASAEPPGRPGARGLQARPGPSPSPRRPSAQCRGRATGPGVHAGRGAAERRPGSRGVRSAPGGVAAASFFPCIFFFLSFFLSFFFFLKFSRPLSQVDRSHGAGLGSRLRTQDQRPPSRSPRRRRVRAPRTPGPDPTDPTRPGAARPCLRRSSNHFFLIHKSNNSLTVQAIQEEEGEGKKEKKRGRNAKGTLVRQSVRRLCVKHL
ncbi:uncharacterized protein LOC112649359 [Canis lupus dingo]|uniref:uncharacterized protein LOC112649359 n=1 Tax=Canis lupus dingo TaxID=286419 RepID=UPI0020C402C3|nr:uncharacterized protein LOC112649359 [Canis lupus dingo]